MERSFASSRFSRLRSRIGAKMLPWPSVAGVSILRLLNSVRPWMAPVAASRLTQSVLSGRAPAIMWTRFWVGS